MAQPANKGKVSEMMEMEDQQLLDMEEKLSRAPSATVPKPREVRKHLLRAFIQLLSYASRFSAYLIPKSSISWLHGVPR